MNKHESRLLTRLEDAFDSIKGEPTPEAIEGAIKPYLRGMDAYGRSRLGRKLWEYAKESLDWRMEEGEPYKYYPLAQHLDPIVGGA